MYAFTESSMTIDSRCEARGNIKLQRGLERSKRRDMTNDEQVSSGALNAGTATPKQAIDKDKVRMMVADFGYKKTSEALNIKEPTLRKWAERGKWNTPTITDQRVTLVTKPIANAHADALQAYKEQSKVNLAKYAAEASQEASEHPQKLSISRKAKDVADIRASIWPQESNNSNILQIGFLIGPRPERDEKQVVDNSSGTSES